MLISMLIGTAAAVAGAQGRAVKIVIISNSFFIIRLGYTIGEDLLSVKGRDIGINGFLLSQGTCLVSQLILRA